MTDKDIELAKEKIKKLDPGLVMLAIQEMDIKTDEVEKAKKGIREVYDSISDTEKKQEILSKAFDELEPEIIDKEIKNVKAILEEIDKDVLLKATKDLEIAASARFCIKYLIECGYLIGCGYRIGCLDYRIGCGYRIGCLDYRIGCLDYRIGCLDYRIGCLDYRIGCLDYRIGCKICIRHGIICTTRCLSYNIICNSYMLGCGNRLYEVEECNASISCRVEIGVGPLSPEEIVTQELKEEAVKEVVKSPELSKAIAKMIKEMKKKGEI